MPTLNTRIKLKYDTLANWSAANPVLLAGEVAVVAIPTESEPTVGQVTKPAIVFKVGDGTTEFNTLPYASGLAADVYSWAKAATKPSYTAGEVGADAAGTAAGLIGGLDVTDSAVGGQYVSAVSQVDGKIQVTRASLPTVNIPEYTLQAGDAEGTIELLKGGAVVGTAVEVTGWAELVAEVAAKYVKPAGGIPKTDLASAVQTSLGKADTAVQSVAEGTTNGTIAVDGEDVPVHGLGSAAYTESSAYDAAGAASSAVGTHNTAPDAHADIRSQVTALAEKVSGRATAYVYQNKSDEDYTTAIGKAGSFVVGDTIYFLDADIPDEWVTAVNAEAPFYTFQEIETESPSFDGYVTGTGLTANKIVLGNAGSAVKASVYGIVTTLTATDNANVATSKAVADYVASLGYQTAANVNSLIQAATIQGSKVSGAVAEAAGYTEDGAIASALEGKEDAGTAAALIAGLDVAAITVGANQTLASISEADGIITATPVAIAIDASQVTSGTFNAARIPALAISKITGLQDELNSKLESADIANLATKEEVNAKQDALIGAQLNAVNSGITAAKVATYDGYAANIAALEAKPGLDKVGTVTSVAGANGIKVTGTATTTPVVEIDTAAVFILDCGTATTNID